MIATPRRRTRASRPVAALAIALFAVIVPVGASIPAAVAASGYSGQGDSQLFDNYGGNRVLPIMTEGEAYSATLTGPQFGGSTSWCWSVVDGALPGGITMSPSGDSCAPSTTFSGTPEAGEFSFDLRVSDTAFETNLTLTFSGVIESGKTPTVTTLTVPAVARHDVITVSATVVGTPPGDDFPSGTVEFRTGGALLGSATLVDGVATTNVSVDAPTSASPISLTAVYLGDATYATSTSSAQTLRIFTPAAAGTVMWNGSGAEDVLVALIRLSDNTVVDVDDTNNVGHFSVTPGAITDAAGVDATYLLRATFEDDTVIYFEAGEINTTEILDADSLTPGTWGATLTITRQSGPSWDDDGLPTPRVGAVYSNGVTAKGRGAVTYSVTAGALPAGLTLNSATGAVTGTPTACAPNCGYSFTIAATNGYGTVSESFSGTLLPPGVPPTWDDDELPELRQDVAVTDGVVAVGDPTISYAVTSGTLPTGLILSATTGAVTGTPTAPGAYAFTITASNDFGSIHATFEGEVAEKPALALVLDFAPGTTIDDAASTISAEGLLVGSDYTLTMYSTPRVLYTGTVGASGGFTWVVKLPADTPVGPHRLVLTGTAANGTAMSATAWFSLRADGRIGAVSYTGPIAGLANTGDSSPVGLALLAGVLLAAGVGALRMSLRPTP